MKQIAEVWFDVGRGKNRTATSVLKRSRIPSSAIKSAIESFRVVVLPYGDDRLEHLAEQLAAHHITLERRTKNVYSHDELVSAELLHMYFNIRESGTSGPAAGTEYDLTRGCSACHCAAPQNGELRIDKNSIPHQLDVAQTCQGDVVLSQRMTRAIDAISGRNNTIDTVDAHNGNKLLWQQLWPSQELPPMLLSSEGIVQESKCSMCQRDGIFYSTKRTLVPHVSRRLLGDLRTVGVARSWERLGHCRVDGPRERRVIAQPLFFVNGRVAEVILKRKARGVRFTPVTIVEG